MEFIKPVCRIKGGVIPPVADSTEKRKPFQNLVGGIQISRIIPVFAVGIHIIQLLGTGCHADAESFRQHMADHDLDTVFLGKVFIRALHSGKRLIIAGFQLDAVGSELILPG